MFVGNSTQNLVGELKKLLKVSPICMKIWHEIVKKPLLLRTTCLNKNKKLNSFLKNI